MIQNATLKAFIPTTDLDRSRQFYVEVLGLEFVGVDPFAVTVRYGSTLVRLVKVEKLTPAPFTILGWDVTDIRRQVRLLADSKLTFTRYEGLEQDEDAIWTAPGGGRVAWFRDPDGNVLALKSTKSLISTDKRHCRKWPERITPQKPTSGNDPDR